MRSDVSLLSSFQIASDALNTKIAGAPLVRTCPLIIFFKACNWLQSLAHILDDLSFGALQGWKALTDPMEVEALPKVAAGGGEVLPGLIFNLKKKVS